VSRKVLVSLHKPADSKRGKEWEKVGIRRKWKPTVHLRIAQVGPVKPGVHMQVLLVVHFPLFWHWGLHVSWAKMVRETWEWLQIPRTQVGQSVGRLDEKHEILLFQDSNSVE
jgi:hypothetical protein